MNARCIGVRNSDLLSPLNEESALARQPGGRVSVMESESSPFERTEGVREEGRRGETERRGRNEGREGAASSAKRQSNDYSCDDDMRARASAD